MTGSLGVARIVVLGLGLTMFVAGLATMTLGGAGAFLGGFWLGAIGLAFIIGALIERVRYRSEATDRSGDPAGRAGGEPPGTRLEPRFRRSDEVFADPTSGQRMRVWVDPANGDRRYLPEE
ncbi:MAG TPA: hypothetical protein VGQ31_07680 [Candidatus Limnocylindrales bacterium]|jgi:hypothetical protein|nr:hypothetical protein [Candidatus Limnocylindrales bacterium]